MKFNIITALAAALTTVSAVAISAAAISAAAVTSRDLPAKWYIGDDLPLPERFILNVTSPSGEFAGYKFSVEWSIIYDWSDNLRLSPADLDVNDWSVADVFYGEDCRFYFQPTGGPRLYMDVFALASRLVHFRPLEQSHYHAGYTFDGYRVWNGRLVRRYEMNDGYKVAPQSLWVACGGYDEGEVDLTWDSARDVDSPYYQKDAPPLPPSCSRVEIIVTAV